MTQFFSSSLGPADRTRMIFDWSAAAPPPSAPPGWSVPEALLFLLFSAATCDGALSHQEHEALLAALPRSRALGALGQEQLEATNTAVLERLRAARPDTLNEACAALPAAMRLPAFAHALDMVLADGELVAPEAAFLNALIAALDLPTGEVQRVADVLLLKNQI